MSEQDNTAGEEEGFVRTRLRFKRRQRFVLVHLMPADADPDSSPVLLAAMHANLLADQDMRELFHEHINTLWMAMLKRRFDCEHVSSEVCRCESQPDA